MKTTQQFSITLPHDMAEAAERINQGPMAPSAKSRATAWAPFWSATLRWSAGFVKKSSGASGILARSVKFR
jgi:hypothetical protein